MSKLSAAVPQVSIILPALTVNSDYLRCLYSIRAALSGKVSYEIISIVRDIKAFTNLASPDLRIFLEEGPGIYRAMNLGIDRAAGEYIYFIGQDDILLPDAAASVVRGSAREADVILANVFWGSGRIHRNYVLRQSLVWTNWCHQGVFYKRTVFVKIVGSFPLEYKAQADHYSNIVLSTNRTVRVVKYNGCIAWYSATGFSTQSPDLVFRAAFPGLVREHFGLISYCSVKLRRALLKCIKLMLKAK
ncbi:glycosyltransferase [Edaphobacter flagellatus]|uniref:glycosyltransferase n=1 Tax=Edaphobacter flagellatus TaxID=1933044 RepID=UPI0021B2F49C|nr:glycosyltransferase [Edaphobacter flagellatus]